MTSAKLKMLVWRDWRLCRKTYLSGLAACIVVTVFFWLIRLSMSVGNLAPIFAESDLLTEFGSVLYYMSTLLVATVSMSLLLDVKTLQSDINANWMCYSFTLPIAPKERAAGIYIVKLIKMLLGFGFAALNAFVTAKITGMPFTADMIWLLTAILACILFYDTAIQFFLSKARTIRGISEAQMKVLFPLMAAVMLYGLFKIVLYPSEAETGDINVIISNLKEKFLSHESVIVPVSLIVIAVCLVFGWFITAQHSRTYGDIGKEKESGSGFTLKKKKDGEAE